MAEKIAESSIEPGLIHGDNDMPWTFFTLRRKEIQAVDKKAFALSTVVMQIAPDCCLQIQIAINLARRMSVASNRPGYGLLYLQTQLVLNFIDDLFNKLPGQYPRFQD